MLDDNPEALAISDINGRFLFDYVAYGRHKMSFHKDGYEDSQTAFDFLTKSQISYSRLVSQESLFAATERAIEERKWEDAMKFLSRADQIERKEPLSSYLYALIEYRRKDYEKAARILEAIADRDYREPYVFLFLADVYEKHLNDPEGAIRNLKAYLALREDGDLRSRLERLEKARR